MSFFMKAVDLCIYGISFDNTALLSVLQEILEDSKPNIWRINWNYQSNFEPQEVPQRGDETWAPMVTRTGLAMYANLLTHFHQRYNSMVSYNYIKMVNYFGNRNGFAVIMGRLKKTDPKVTIPFLRDLIRIFSRVCSSVFFSSQLLSLTLPLS